MFVDGSEDVRILKGEFKEDGNPEFVSLHPGWNVLDMNGEFKDGFVTYSMDDFEKTKHIKNVDFTKFTGKSLNGGMFGGTGISNVILPVVDTIPIGIFNQCISLNNVIIPEGVEFIKNGAFYQTAISNITLPHTIKQLDYGIVSNGYEHDGHVIIKFKSIVPPSMIIDTFMDNVTLEVPNEAVETYKNINIPGWKEKFGDKIVGY